MSAFHSFRRSSCSSTIFVTARDTRTARSAPALAAARRHDVLERPRSFSLELSCTARAPLPAEFLSRYKHVDVLRAAVTTSARERRVRRVAQPPGPTARGRRARGVTSSCGRLVTTRFSRALTFGSSCSQLARSEREVRLSRDERKREGAQRERVISIHSGFQGKRERRRGD